MSDQIHENWQPQPNFAGTVIVKFTIQRDGTITGVAVEKAERIYWIGGRHGAARDSDDEAAAAAAGTVHQSDAHGSPQLPVSMMIDDTPFAGATHPGVTRRAARWPRPFDSALAAPERRRGPAAARPSPQTSQQPQRRSAPADHRTAAVAPTRLAVAVVHRGDATTRETVCRSRRRSATSCGTTSTTNANSSMIPARHAWDDRRPLGRSPDVPTWDRWQRNRARTAVVVGTVRRRRATGVKVRCKHVPRVVERPVGVRRRIAAAPVANPALAMPIRSPTRFTSEQIRNLNGVARTRLAFDSDRDERTRHGRHDRAAVDQRKSTSPTTTARIQKPLHRQQDR